MTREEEIVGLLVEASDAYYNTDETILSDAEFDQLSNELRSINPNNPFFSVVGFKSRYGQSVTHVYPMRSMDKCNTFEELQKYGTKIPEAKSYIWEHKIDGGSITLKYNSRKFLQGATRGDGKAGLDVTHTLAYVPNLPKTILYHGEVEIRGEVILPKDTKFDTKGKPLRNSANGLVARKTADMDCANLRFIAYNVICPGLKFANENDKLQFLVEQGFEVTPFGVVSSLQDVQKVYLEYHNRIRAQLPYEIDGLIIMPNDTALQEKYEDGDVKHPAWAIAYKFPNEERETKLLDIEWNVSRLGLMIPVAILEPVNVGGRTVTKTSLSNYENVLRMKLEIGDRVTVEVANDVIPYLAKNISKGISQR